MLSANFYKAGIHDSVTVVMICDDAKGNCRVDNGTVKILRQHVGRMAELSPDA